MTAPRETITIAASLDAVEAAALRVRACMPQGLSEESRYLLELGVAEALTNIVLHGYAGRSDGEIDIACHADADRFWVRIDDGGSPLPAAKLAQADAAAFEFDESDIDAIPEGGRGLPLLKAAYDEVIYCQDGGRNRLTLIKHLSVSHAPK